MRVAPITFLYLLFISVLLLSCSKDNEKLLVEKEAPASQELLDLIVIGHALFDVQKFDSAFYFYNKGKTIAIKENNYKKAVSCIANIAEIQQIYADYVNSEETCIEALPYLKKIKDPNYAWNIYITLGVNYLHNYNYSEALKYFNKAYNLDTDQQRKLDIKNNIAVVYIAQENFEKSIEILLNLLEYRKLIDDEKLYARILANLAVSYEQTNSNKSFTFNQKSLEINTQINNEWGIIYNYNILASYYKNRDPKLASSYARKAYNLASRYKSTTDRLIALKVLISTSKGNTLQTYAEKYVQITDSVAKQKQISKNQFAKIKYDSSVANKENEILKSQKITTELELEREKYKKLLSYVLICLMLLVCIAIYYYLLYRNKIEKSTAIYKSETRISKKLHDELANEIYQTITMVESKNLANKENKEQLLNNLDIIYSQTRNISYQNRIINTDETFAEFLKEMISTYNSSAIQIIVKDLNLINWNSISAAQKITVYRVIQELLVNMKKHSQSSFVIISFTSLAKEIKIDYCDNGIGINPEKISAKNGLKNAENRLKSIKGSLTYNSILDKGFKASIKFPIT